MTFDDELAICQFGQGALSSTEVLDQFRLLGDFGKSSRLLELYFEVTQSEFAQDAVQEALAHGLILETDDCYELLNLEQLRTRSKASVIEIPHTKKISEAHHEAAFEALLQLFRIVFQHNQATDESNRNTISWWKEDLSDAQLVQDIKKSHQARVEQVYADPGYRSEFLCMAKLWNENNQANRNQTPEPDYERLVQNGFLSYEEVMAESIRIAEENNSYPLLLLRESLTKALSTRYRISTREADFVLLDVLERYLRTTYGSGLRE